MTPKKAEKIAEEPSKRTRFVAAFGFLDGLIHHSRFDSFDSWTIVSLSINRCRKLSSCDYPGCSRFGYPLIQRMHGERDGYAERKLGICDDLASR